MIKMKKIKKIKLYFIFYLIIIIVFIYRYQSLNIKNIKSRINSIKICLCTLGKKENRYIREYITYYQKYGIDQIFLYDNNDEDDERFEEVIYDYIEQGFVKLFNWRGRQREQLNILNHCYANNYEKFDWLIFYDLDEYINLKRYSNIKEFLNEKKFNKCEIIYLNWIIHTDNNLIHYDNRTLHERFPIIEQKARNHNKNYFIPVKSILRGHIPNITINCLHKLNSKLIPCNGFGDKPKLVSYSMEPDFKYYFIDHFYFKSLEEFTEKLNRGSARTYDDMNMKLVKLYRYFTMNEININKLNYISNKTGINITSLKNKSQFKNINKIN